MFFNIFGGSPEENQREEDDKENLGKLGKNTGRKAINPDDVADTSFSPEEALMAEEEETSSAIQYEDPMRESALKARLDRYDYPGNADPDSDFDDKIEENNRRGGFVDRGNGIVLPDSDALIEEEDILKQSREERNLDISWDLKPRSGGRDPVFQKQQRETIRGVNGDGVNGSDEEEREIA